eukprot:5156239-Amphidinium_carterae.1
MAQSHKVQKTFCEFSSAKWCVVVSYWLQLCKCTSKPLASTSLFTLRLQSEVGTNRSESSQPDIELS